jgi:AcrR family transcriptional regulator
LSRAQQQERTRAAVLAAARAEFAEHGYGDAKVDRIAERAELTRGAVYSNFPSKRALYLAVLLASIDRAGERAGPAPQPPGLAEALGAFARVRLERLPLTGDTSADGRLRLRSLAGVFDDEPGRAALAQVTALEALLLALPLESRLPRPRTRARRRVRLAELVLTLLDGVGHLAETAPGFGDPFDVVAACEHLAGLGLTDSWDPPHLPHVPPAQPARDAWEPPAELSDQLSGRPVRFDADGVIAILGTDRLAAAEEAIRAARPGEQVTVAVVTSDPAEFGRLVRLRVGDLVGSLRGVFGREAWPGLRLVLDDDAAFAPAAGVPAAGAATEAAVRVEAGRIVARAHGRGAPHAAASARDPSAARAAEETADEDE